MRDAIMAAVEQQPGIHFRGLQRAVDCSTSTVDHHVRHGPITDRDVRGYRRLYPRDVPARLHSPLAALNHETRGPILAALVDAQELRFGRIVDRLDHAPSTVSHHCTVLVDADLVTVEADGRATRYRPTHPAVEAIDRHGDTVLDRLADGFIALWE